jgi:hypothetical protein
MDTYELAGGLDTSWILENQATSHAQTLIYVPWERPLRLKSPNNSVDGSFLNHMVLLNELIILLTYDIAPSLNDNSRTSRRGYKFSFKFIN